jgi:hypothetical protein
MLRARITNVARTARRHAHASPLSCQCWCHHCPRAPGCLSPSHPHLTHRSGSGSTHCSHLSRLPTFPPRSTIALTLACKLLRLVHSRLLARRASDAPGWRREGHEECACVVFKGRRQRQRGREIRAGRNDAMRRRSAAGANAKSGHGAARTGCSIQTDCASAASRRRGEQHRAANKIIIIIINNARVPPRRPADRVEVR